MEIRALRYTWRQWDTGGHREHVNAVRIDAGDDFDPYVMVLQYRDGVTHDAPWIDIPVVDFHR